MRLDPGSEAEEMLKRKDPPKLLALLQVQLSAIWTADKWVDTLSSMI
jgi:hypothetical protein